MIKDALETLGTKIDASQERDAVHVAVLPIEASEALHPGQHVGISDGKACSRAEQMLGIVDPFVNGDFEPGEWLWLMLYPRTITSLRHEWVHPEIERREAAEQKTRSEQWLQDFVDHADCPGYHELIAAALEHEADGWDSQYLVIRGQDASGYIPDEFWVHMEIVTGQKFKKRAEYFSCSC